MSNFSDYESSHITPQMTLLKKFNEVLKYLREFHGIKQNLYLHILDYKPQMGSRANFYVISTLEQPFISVEESSSNSSVFMDNLFIYCDLFRTFKLTTVYENNKYKIAVSGSGTLYGEQVQEF